MGDSSRAAGRSWVTSGFVSLANCVRRASVSFDSRWKVGSARKVASSSWLRAAVVAKTRLEFVDQRAQLAIALAERLEDRAGVAHHALHVGAAGR